MPNYIIEIVAEGDREAGLQYVVAQENKAIEARNASLPDGQPPEPKTDATQYLTDRLNGAVDSYAREALGIDQALLKQKFAEADEATREAIKVAAQF